MRLAEDAPYKRITVDVVIPVHNEEAVLARNVRELRDYLEQHFPYQWNVVIVDNASTDRTWEIAQGLAEEPNIRAIHLEQKGRGRALRTAWLASNADVVSYMDVDLSTNLKSFLPLVAPIITGHSDVAIGSRLLKSAVVQRQLKREIISRIYNLMIKTLFRNRFSDAQCGFKALSRKAARDLLPQVENQSWFFDTEVLLLAEECGLRIYEVPVQWIEDLDTRVNITRTALEDIKGLLRVRRQRWSRKLGASQRAVPS
jgi:glycosyltransferase involved in cell wall biosynthesis